MRLASLTLTQLPKCKGNPSFRAINRGRRLCKLVLLIFICGSFIISLANTIAALVYNLFVLLPANNFLLGRS